MSAPTTMRVWGNKSIRTWLHKEAHLNIGASIGNKLPYATDPGFISRIHFSAANSGSTLAAKRGGGGEDGGGHGRWHHGGDDGRRATHLADLSCVAGLQAGVPWTWRHMGGVLCGYHE
jgi:hypothetical protein